MNSKYIKNLVFGVTKEKAIDYLKTMIGEFKYKDIKQVKRSRDDFRVELTDGTIYQVVIASQGARGYRCDRVYVDKFIDDEILNCVIKPLLIISELPTEEQIVYF